MSGVCPEQMAASRLQYTLHVNMHGLHFAPSKVLRVHKYYGVVDTHCPFFATTYVKSHGGVRFHVSRLPNREMCNYRPLVIGGAKHFAGRKMQPMHAALGVYSFKGTCMGCIFIWRCCSGRGRDVGSLFTHSVGAFSSSELLLVLRQFRICGHHNVPGK